MGLFVRRNAEESQPLYKSGGSSTAILIVGLGNIGKDYEGTRHNIGFACVDNFAAQQGFPAWIEKKDQKCLITKQTIGSAQVILIKPTTFMNESGRAVQSVQHFYKLANSSTLVVHDDLDVEFGQIRARQGGGSAGNNGIKSVIQHVGDDFARIRIGIKDEMLEKMDSADFVLAKFDKEERGSMPKLTREVSAMLSEYIANNELPHDTRNFL